MNDGDNRRSFGATLQYAFAIMVNEKLPAAARDRAWPISSPEGFERILLDHALGAPWETVLPRSSATTATAIDLMVAIEMGERLSEGTASIARLNRRSLAMRAVRVQRSGMATEPDRCLQEVGALFGRARIAQVRAARRSGG